MDKKPPPLPTAEHKKIEIVEWQSPFGALPQGTLLLCIVGLLIAFFGFGSWADGGRRPDALASLFVFLFIGGAMFFGSVAYFVKSLRTVRYEDAPLAEGETPSAHQTRLASENFRVALAYYNEIFTLKDNNAQLGTISLASEYLAKARRYDPSVTVVDKSDPKQPATWAQDEFAALLLWTESDLYTKQADAAHHNEMSVIGYDYASKLSTKRYKEERREALTNAQTAIEKALRYQPHNVTFLCQLAKIHYGLGNQANGNETVLKAYNLDPDNIEVLKLKTASL